jgi:hypothetical protein
VYHQNGLSSIPCPNEMEIFVQTRISEIASGIYRLSTFVPEIVPPAGFCFNQFLVLGDEPLMFQHRLAQDVSA